MPSCGVRSSVRLSSNDILRLFSPSGSHTILVFQYQYSDGDPLNECRLRKQKSRFLMNIWLLINDFCSANNNCDCPSCSLLHIPPCISESMFITTSMDDHDEEQRTEQYLFVHSVKSEAEVTDNSRLHSTYCTVEANY